MNKVYLLHFFEAVHPYSSEEYAYRAAAIWLRGTQSKTLQVYLTSRKRELFLDAIMKENYQEAIEIWNSSRMRSQTTDQYLWVEERIIDAPAR